MANDLKTIVGWIGKYTRQLIATKAEQSEVDALSGGKVNKEGDTITGNFFGDNNRRALQIGAGTNNTDGAYLQCIGGGASSSAGRIALIARTSSDNVSNLLLYPNGNCNINSDVVERVVSSGNGYVRYYSGFQICWGGVTASTSGVNVTFPQAFSSNPHVITSPNGYTITTGCPSVTTKNATLTANGNAYTRYLAIGWWK